MSSNYTSYAVIGIQIPMEDDVAVIGTKIMRNGCEHNVPLNKRFCSECGKPRITFARYLYWDNINLKSSKLDRVFDTDGENTYIGYIVSSGIYGSDATRRPLPDINAVRENIVNLGKTAKVPDGFKENFAKLIKDNLDSFGLWAVQYCSY